MIKKVETNGESIYNLVDKENYENDVILLLQNKIEAIKLDC